MTRERKPEARSTWTYATACLLAAYALFVCLDFRHHGITYDEAFQVEHGANVAAWYSSGFEDRSFHSYRNLRWYGAAFDLTGHVAQSVTGMDPYEVRHLLAGLLAVLAAAGVAALSSRLAGPAAGFFALIILLATPRFLGHGFVNPKDIPLAAAHVWAIHAIIVLVAGLPSVSRRRILYTGIIMGLTLGVRMGGVVVLGYLALGLALWWLHRLWRDGTLDLRHGLAAARRVSLVLLGAGAVAWVVMMPFYPIFHLNPVVNPLRALMSHARGNTGTLRVLFDGVTTPSDELPAIYVWSWLMRILPETYLIGLAVAVVCAVALLKRSIGRKPLPVERLIGWLMVGLAFLFPLAVATIGRPAVYDGLRHFLFATILLAVPAGAGIAALLQGRGPFPVRALAFTGFLVTLGMVVTSAFRLHPYEAVYFNRIVAGGLKGAEGRFETDYWGFSLKEGIEWLVASSSAPGTRPRVSSNCYSTQTEHYLPTESFDYIGSIDHLKVLYRTPYADPPDYHIATTRWGGHRRYPGDVVYRVEREGVTLLVVVKVDRQAALELHGESSRQ